VFIGADFARGEDKTVVLYKETEGCGQPGCVRCRNSKEAFARIDGWNQARKQEKVSGTLANLLTDEATKTVFTQIDAYFDGQIKAKNQEAEKTQAEIDAREATIRALREKRNTLRKEVDELTATREAVKKAVKPAVERGNFYYLSSRTGDSAGHYVERWNDGKTKCHSCQAARYNGKCWAATQVSAYPSYGRLFYSAAQFDKDAAAAAAKV
jgi:vacuolar-type H+-ATPase subunit I/STV1